MHLSHLHLQFDRLRRHYDAALQTRDQITFLDLAHCLRVWVDMKTEVVRIASDLGVQLSLRHHQAPKFIKKSLQGATHTYIPLASGVPSSGVQVVGVRITNRALTPEEIKQRAAAGPPIARATEMTFAEWMAAGVIEVPSGDATHPHITLSREILIKRIANTLGASHPAGMEDNDPRENRFDQYIAELHALQLTDYPATYYQLLEIAGELIARVQVLRDSAA